MKAFVTPKEKTQGGIGVFISVIGWLVIALGAVVGVYFGMNGKIVIAEIDQAGFSWTIAAICWIVGIILGLVLIGIGNIIEVLVGIANREYEVKVVESGERKEGRYFGNSGYNGNNSVRNDVRNDVRREAPVGVGVDGMNGGEVRRRRRSESGNM